MKLHARHGWTALRLAVGALFVAASVYKILSPGDFAHQIHNYKLLPPALVNPAAIILPWVQLLVGGCLLAGRLSAGASALASLMMLVFFAAVASAVARGLNISCGCFKAGGSAASGLTLVRDGAFLAAALLNAWHLRRVHGTR